MNILLAVDQSQQSQAAVSLLDSIQFPAGSKLLLLYVLEPQQWTAEIKEKHQLHMQTVLSSVRSKFSTEARQFLSKLKETCRKPHLKIISLVNDGIPGGAILSAIDKYNIDLVVLGTHGKTGLKRFLLGSVSEWVLTEAPCSVLIVRKKSQSKKKRGTGLNLLIANDGSLDSTYAIDFTRQLKFPPTSNITVCHVIEEQYALRNELAARLGVTGKPETAKLAAEILKIREHEGKELLNSCASKLKRGGRPIKKLLTYGHPADQLLTLAQGKKADVVVVGSRGITGLRRVFLGSVSNKVVSHAPCSVLVVRQPKEPRREKSRT